MNRTQRITSEWLRQAGLAGDELLLEALLRRGFLAFRDAQGVWLGTGSHPADLEVLMHVDGLEVVKHASHKDRMARVKSKSPDVPMMGVAVAIVGLPENHLEGHSLMTGWGIPGFIGSAQWNSYRKMAWGAKLPTCPMTELGRSEVRDALDVGVALLVKVLPLARVATRVCCDGHGEKPAWISMCSDWSALWGKAVFDVLAEAAPNSMWKWNSDLHIAPQGEYSDMDVLGMLNDIQRFSRRLLNQSTIDKIGRARGKTLEAFGEFPPHAERFAQEARHQLREEFTYR